MLRVVLERDGSVDEASSPGQVVLAAGSIGTPQILMLSGIGPGEHLSLLGIPVVCDLPGVGANLQDHLQIRTAFEHFRRPHAERHVCDVERQGWIAARYAVARSGPMAMAPSQLGLFTRSDPRYATPNLEFHVQPLSLDAFGAPLHRYPAITVSACNLRPQSAGSVRLAAPDHRTHPVIAPDSSHSPEDRDVAVASIRIARRLMAARRLASHKPREIAPGPEVDGEARSLQRRPGGSPQRSSIPSELQRWGPMATRRRSSTRASAPAASRISGSPMHRLCPASSQGTLTRPWS